MNKNVQGDHSRYMFKGVQVIIQNQISHLEKMNGNFTLLLYIP